MIKVSIIGATGYAGEELTRLLLRHPEVELANLGSKSYAGKQFSKVYPGFFQILDKKLSEPDLEKFSRESDVVFLALPHGIASKEVTESILEKTKIIDLGADFRIDNLKTYENWYKTEHFGQKVLEEAVYGLVELNREKIKKARLVANPGCYTTASIMALAPLVKEGIIDLDSIIIDAASGVTGAGRSTKLDNSFCEVDEDFKAYGLTNHRHTPEIEQELSKIGKTDIKLNFTPHLIPMQRGILATCYGNLKKGLSEEEGLNLFESFYKDEPFVRIRKNNFPQTKFVKGSNYIDIGLKIDSRTNRIIVLSAIDNLIKGAAGQAVQNMNVLFGLKETLGLELIPDCPI